MASTSPYSIPLFFFSSLILTNFIPTVISLREFYTYNCSYIGNYANTSIYKTNIDSLLSSISSNTQITYGFYNLSAGEESNKVNAVALCRGDLTVDECRRCVNDSTYQLLQTCPNQIEAMGWYDECMLGYSNKSIFRERNWIGWKSGANPVNVSNISEFNAAVTPLLNSLRTAASSGNSTLKFATGDTVDANFQTIYGLVQCTPDLSGSDCSDCLDQAIQFIPKCCDGGAGARVLTPTCNLRYEISRFYNISTPVGPVPPTPTTPPTKGKNNTIVIAIVVPTVSVVLLLLIICFFRSRREEEAKEPLSTMENS